MNMNIKGLKEKATSSVQRFELSRGSLDPLVWSKDHMFHSCGSFSFAVLSSTPRECRSEIQTGSNAMFVGIYDGSCGDDAASFLERKFFKVLMNETKRYDKLEVETLGRAVNSIEEKFINTVRTTSVVDRPNITRAGSCCLALTLFKNDIYLSNVGDSKAYVCFLKDDRSVGTCSLIGGHSITDPDIKAEIVKAHDEGEGAFKNEKGEVEGLLKQQVRVAKAIGHANLKLFEFVNHNDSAAVWELSHLRPYLTAKPDLSIYHWQKRDQFMIIGTAAFWSLVDIIPAARTVQTNPKEGSAKLLIKLAEKNAATVNNITYDNLLAIPASRRKEFYGNIAVVVVFIDADRLGRHQADFVAKKVVGETDFPESAFAEIERLMK